MLFSDHLNSLSLPAIFDDLLKPFKEQRSQNTRRARRYVLNTSKMKNLFFMVPDQFSLNQLRTGII